MAGKVIKNGLRWLVICIIVFLISIFLHECGHGLANHLRGISCSTGFNRVGDIYKYPKDVDFRATYRNASESLLDFGVPITLLLASAGTFCACSYKQHAASDSMHICAFCSIIYRERMERRRI